MGEWHGYPIADGQHPSRPWWRSTRWWWSRHHEGRELYEMSADLAAVDAAHPIPAPEPRCGQVWVHPDGEAYLVHHVSAYTQGVNVEPVWRIGYSDHMGLRSPGWAGTGRAWPAEGAVLVAGPGAPWGPMGVPGAGIYEARHDWKGRITVEVTDDE